MRSPFLLLALALDPCDVPPPATPSHVEPSRPPTRQEVGRGAAELCLRDGRPADCADALNPPAPPQPSGAAEDHPPAAGPAGGRQP